jgi:hypothetical protein
MEKVLMLLEMQIANLSAQQKRVILEMMQKPSPRPARKKQLESTADFFQSVIGSLNELKHRRENEKQLEISLGDLYDKLNLTEISKGVFLEIAAGITKEPETKKES